MMQRILIIEESTGFSSGLGGVLSADADIQVYGCISTSDACSLIAEQAPQVVVLGPSVDGEDAVIFADEQKTALAGSELVLVTSAVTTDLMRRAMRAGFADVLSTADAVEDVAIAVRRALSATRAKPVVPVKPAPAAAVTRPKGRVITVFSTKGGVGKSVIAVNLAAALASTFGRKVILLDLDLQFGDAGILLNLTPERTIHDAAQMFDRLDPEMLSGFLTTHKSGARVLLAPVRPEDADAVTVSRTGAIIEMLRELADIVIIDTAATFDDVVLTAIDHSHELYAIATLDVTSVKNTRVSLQKLRQLGYDSSRVKLVLNRADAKVLLDPGEVERSLQGTVVARIPSDRLVPRSVNRGEPVVFESPKSGVARSLVTLAASIAKAGTGVAGDVA